MPDNSAGNLDYGWLGQNQKGLEHAPGITTIEMGARPYVPGMGRFVGVDPVEGGSCNDYDYVCGDPVNGRDTSGLQFDNTNVLLFLADPLPSSDDVSVFSSTFLHIHAITTTPVRFSGSVKVQRRQGGKWVDIDTSTRINSEVFPGEVGDDFLPIRIPMVQSGRFRVHVNLYIKNLDTGHTVHFIQDGIIVCQDYRCRREGGNIGT